MQLIESAHLDRTPLEGHLGKMLFCGANKKIYRNVEVQIGGSSFKDAEAQCGESKGSYQ